VKAKENLVGGLTRVVDIENNSWGNISQRKEYKRSQRRRDLHGEEVW